jgi:hypothetical protein
VNSTVKTVLFWLLIGVSALLLWEIEVYGMEVRGRYRDGTQFHTTTPTNYFTPEMLKNLHDQGILIKFRDINSGNIPLTLLGTWAPLILLGALWFFMIRRMQSGGNKALSFGKSRARLLFKDEVNFTAFMSAIMQNNIRELEVYGWKSAASIATARRSKRPPRQPTSPPNCSRACMTRAYSSNFGSSAAHKEKKSKRVSAQTGNATLKPANEGSDEGSTEIQHC